MRVALTMRVIQVQGHTEARDALSRDWIRLAGQWGLSPLLIPNGLPDPAGYLGALAPDLLILTGGDDLGDTPERDATEAALIDAALEHDLPILGVCRGLQMINHHFGGSTERVEGHVANDHAVRLSGALADLHGPETVVNSYHDHGIAAAGLADDLKPLAFDAEGHVEAAGHRHLPIFGLMWHPERGVARDQDRQIFERLVKDRTFWI